MIRRKPLRRVSKKRQIELGNYRALRLTHLMEHPSCVVCGEIATDIHHKTPRGRGGKLCDVNIFLSVCRQCHEWIHNNPKEAKAKGLLT